MTRPSVDREAETSRPARPRAGLVESVYLHPGGAFASAAGEDVTTILGSCVSVFLWCPRTLVGAVNHFLLPHAVTNDRSLRFAPNAMQKVLHDVFVLGADPRVVRAKIFGGACVLDAFRREGHLGARNVAAARASLLEAGVPVLAEDVGGERGRKVLFHLRDGSSWVRRL